MSGGVASAAIGIPGDITLGIIAGGRATRLGGRDKAWLQRGGEAQVLRWRRRFAPEVAAILVSSNRDGERLAAEGLAAVPDRIAGAGPMSALDALARACTTPWLFTVPVDLVGVNDCLVQSLAAVAGDTGAFAEDDDGPQPLVALWRVDRLRAAADAALDGRRLQVQALQAGLGMTPLRLSGVRFGNLNTPEDLASAGFDPS